MKLNTHCYTVADLTSFVAHTNEFRFHLTAFHHAHETYLVPDLLKKAYGGPPAIALFSLNADYKMESYFGESTVLASQRAPLTSRRSRLSICARYPSSRELHSEHQE